ncbi:GNAT family N-acetyltransferase [Microbulbifer harenosus]|uniref:N-acetyltransferase family protein n=1 Tax=Microbulbifer harenosus TaxID=2576840 RepID=A0ABY2UGH1_9GAMM|nr:GNAT family N-acetyltransferase [Microbulbifer harenosus]TLM76865.1 N-acetyltransferase family protein [Microbulbifer harenosus]
MNLRHAEGQDLPRIVDIYNSSIASRRSTADTEVVTMESRLQWFRKHHPESRPLLVYEQETEIVGWISFEDFYGRPAYRHTAELSIYIAPENQGKQLGKRLLRAAEEMAPELGLHTLVGYVFAHNTPSMRLLHAHGFQEWGRLPDVAKMDGRNYSLCIMGKRL